MVYVETHINAILDESFTNRGLQKWFKQLLSEVFKPENCYSLPKLVKTLLYSHYTDIEALTRFNKYTLFYYNKELEFSDKKSIYLIWKTYDEYNKLQEITIWNTVFSDQMLRQWLTSINQLNNTDSLNFTNLIATFFYLNKIIIQLKWNNVKAPANEEWIILSYNNILSNYQEDWVKKIINIEAACLLFENFYTDEIKRKQLTKDMNLPTIIDFYDCHIVEMDEENDFSNINVRNIENNFFLTESVFSTEILKKNNFIEWCCFRYVRIEWDDKYVIVPITKEMFDRKDLS